MIAADEFMKMRTLIVGRVTSGIEVVMHLITGKQSKRYVVAS
jgi:hypothetical protein